MEARKQRLRQLLLDFMQANNLSGRQLAKRMNISQTSVTQYLDSTAYPGAENRGAIAKVLGYTQEELDALLEGVALMPKNPVDSLIQDVRALHQEDFLRVAQVVWDRLLSEARTS